MGYSTFVCCVALVFGIFSYGSAKKYKKSQKTSGPSKIYISDNDTIPDLSPPPHPAPPPGTLKLQAKIIEIHHPDIDSLITYDFKVIKIIGIGASTPSVVLNDTVRVRSINVNSIFKKDAILNCSIRHNKAFGSSLISSSFWQILKCK